MSKTGRKRFLIAYLFKTHCCTKNLARYRFAIFIFLITVLSYGCKNQTDKPEQQTTHFDYSTDYFPEKLEVKHAKGFTIRYFNNYKLVDIINRFPTGNDTQHYVLLQRGTPRPKHLNSSYTFIEIPIRNIICLASTHFGLTEFLNVNNLVIGLSDTNYVSSAEIRARIREKKIREVGKGDIINTELIVSMNPDLLMTVGSTASKKGNYEALTASGIKIMANSEWLEATPLGRAEWVKLLAVLVNKEQLANKKFTAIEHAYDSLCNSVKHIKNKPMVITGSSYKGTWFIPGGNTYMANLFKDSGTDFYWSKDTASGVLELSLEAVYPIALNAAIWFNMGTATNRNDIIAQDDRFKLFKSFKTGKLYNCNKRISRQGSNDYWESGVVNPHLVLADIIKIAHPGVLSDDSLTYYKKIE